MQFKKIQLKNVQFAIITLYVVAFLDSVAISLILPILNTEIKKLGGSPYIMGLIRSLYGVVQLFSCPTMGYASDIFGTKLIFLIAIAATSFGYIVQGLAGSLGILVVSRVLLGWFKQTETLGKTLLVEISPATEHPTLISRCNAFGSIGAIVGPWIYLFVCTLTTGYGNEFGCMSFLAVGLFLFSMALVTIFVPEKTTLMNKSKSTELLSKKEGQDQDEELQERYVNANKKSQNSPGFLSSSQLILFVGRFLFCFAAMVPRVNLPLVLEAKFGTSIITYSYLNSIQAISGAISGFILGPILSKYYAGQIQNMLIHGSILQLVSLICLYNSPNFFFAGVSIVMLSASSPFLRTGLVSLSLANSNNDPGRILGFGQFATSFARIIAPLISGLTQEMISIDGPFIAAILGSIFGITSLTILDHQEFQE